MPCKCHKHNENNERRRSERRGERRRDAATAAAAVAATAAAATAATCCAAEAVETENVVTDRFYCCTTPENVAEELYSGVNNDILIRTCYDSSGRSHHDARKRCPFWPSFAHPRWMSCDELYNIKID